MPTADELLGHQVAYDLLASVRTTSPLREFAALDAACREIDGLALRERVDLLAGALLADVPGEFEPLAKVVSKARDGAPRLDRWMIWPVTVAVARRAADEATVEALDEALELLASLTPRLSSEFALRIMLRADLPRTLHAAQAWTTSEDAHVRRLASEGTRSYLPWSLRVPELINSPELTLPIIDALHADESEYVRRSVANHLNDLSRDSPEFVVATAARWLQNPGPSTTWVVRHGLRTLVKKGDGDALALLGYTGSDLVVEDFRVLTPEVAFPGALRFAARIRNAGPEPARIAIDYVVHHLRANGAQTPKTFKLTTRTLTSGEEISVSGEHKFREITARRYYSGAHAVALQINGQQTALASFQLSGVSQA